MRFSLLLTGAFAALATANPVPATKAVTQGTKDLSALVVTQIGKLQADAITLNNTLNTFKPNKLLGVATALKIQNQAGVISTDLTNVTSTTNQSASWDQTNSFNVANAIIGFEPVVFSLLDNIVRKKPAFATGLLLVGDLSQTVESLLVQQQELSRELGSAVGSRLDASLAPYAPIITQQILDKFNSTIAAYRACTGLICLPPI